MPGTWLTPGPTPVPPSVLEAQGRHPVFHRGQAFRRLIAEVTEGLRWVLETSNDVLVLTGSGTGALEAAVVNCFSPGEPILVCVNGFFGERVATIAERFGLEVVDDARGRLGVLEGNAPQLRPALERGGDVGGPHRGAP